MPHFSLGDGKMRAFQGIGPFLIGVLLLVGCQSEENKIEEKPPTTKAEEKVQITKEEEKSIQDVIETFVRTTNEKILLNIWSYFQRIYLVRKT